MGGAILTNIEKFLRIDDTMSAANIMRARAVYFTALIVFLTQIANQISMFFMLGGFYYVHVISMVACLIVLSLGMTLRWTKNFTALTIGFVGVLLLGVISSALPVGRLGVADGINSSMLPLLICGTVMCAIMHSWRAPLIFCVFAFAVIWGFYALSTHYARPDFIITDERIMIHYIRATQATLAMIVSGVITSYFSYRMFGLFDELEANAEAARRAEGLTSRYLADMSHELRTPLNGIIGLSDHLVATSMDPAHKKSAAIINECGEGLLTIINDVLDLSKLDAGNLILSEAPFDLRQLCEHLAALHGAAAAKKGLALQLTYDADVPARFVGDAGRLRQVLNNLLSNAVKFTEQGTIDLMVKSERVSERDHTVKIFVRDSGIGIPASDLPGVFDRFQQVHTRCAEQAAKPAAEKGTGLGLSIAKELIEHMGGKIRVKSTADIGTEFSVFITLPVDHVEHFSTSDLTQMMHALQTGT